MTYVIVKVTDPYNASRCQMSSYGVALAKGNLTKMKQKLYNFARNEDDWIEVYYKKKYYAVNNSNNQPFVYNDDTDEWLIKGSFEYEGMIKGEKCYSNDIWIYKIISLKEAKQSGVDFHFLLY